ncbi:unnamed protein product [Nippostrongylus brasiliensis]|uniref:Reverse transcriptase domain-containing protein n=1 Tax=Nippostrongylus brasiliensis TaxID=27835 RepID=A0A0N4YLY1_NIPBR|nr:unnamed protein product [Nippostrongylus brasiliensis]
MDNGRGLKCPTTEPKHTTVVEAFGKKWTGLLDTGSEISIIPAAVLLAAKESGVSIDREVVEHPTDSSIRVCDASGSIMSFVALVEVNLKEGNDAQREIVARMYVTKTMDDCIILGTNVLPALGCELSRHGATDPAEVKQNGRQAKRGKTCNIYVDENVLSTACVAERVFVATGATSWAKLRGCGRRADTMLTSAHQLIHSGICRIEEDGTVKVAVVNRGLEPSVLRVGEVVGRWDNQEDWDEVGGNEVPGDLLRLQHTKYSEHNRLAKLRTLLTENRKTRTMSGELWRVVQENHEVFAVDDPELTQTDLVTHEIDTGSSPPIRQRTRPVPVGARSELKEILKRLLERGIIERSHSPWASPVVLVRKKNYRELNKQIR